MPFLDNNLNPDKWEMYEEIYAEWVNLTETKFED